MAEVSSESLNSLAEKLEGFAGGLSEDERAALGGVIARAEAANQAEVEGFNLRQTSTNFNTIQRESFNTGLSSQLANSLGGGIDPLALKITVSWGW